MARKSRGYLSRQAVTKRIYRPPPLTFRFWFDSPQECASVALMFLTLAIAVWSIEQAHWIIPQPSLTLVLGLSVFIFLLLGKNRLSDTLTHSLMIISGIAVTIWQSSLLLPLPEITSGSNHLIVTLQSWWQAISASKPSEGTTHFAILLLLITWIAGYISTWSILRKQNAWPAVLLGTVIILVNLSNLTENYRHFFPIYFLAAMLLIGQTNLSREHNWLKKYGGSYPKRVTVYFMASVFCLSLLTISVIWFTPEIRAKQLESAISTLIPRGGNIEKQWFNIFAAVPGKWDIIRSSEQKTLLFSQAVDYGNEVQFVITAEQPLYLRTRRYDTYNLWGWTSNTTDSQILQLRTPLTRIESSPDRRELTYTVENRLKTDVLLTAGEFIATDIPVLLQTLPTSVNVTSTTHSPETTRATDTVFNQNEVKAGDIIAVISPQLLKPKQRYRLTVSFTSTTPEELSQAGDNYTQSIADYYLQLPDSLPERVRQFSQTLTEEAETAYDKAIIIQSFLNEFKYKLETEIPPEGTDAVDYFLFERQEGDCVNFASTMTVMLRSVGVPARFSTGYLQGTLDKNTGKYIVRARDYHSWTEVYFPGYGWVEFEATTRLETAEDTSGRGGTTSTILDDEEDELTGPGGTSLEDATLTEQPGRNTPFPTTFVLFLLVFILGIVFYRWLRRFTRAKHASDVYAKMCFLASLINRGPNPHETPFEYSARLSSVLPLQVEAINNITQAYTESRYSPRKRLFLLQEISLEQYWHDVYRALLKHALRWRR